MTGGVQGRKVPARGREGRLHHLFGFPAGAAGKSEGRTEAGHGRHARHWSVCVDAPRLRSIIGVAWMQTGWSPPRSDEVSFRVTRDAFHPYGSQKVSIVRCNANEPLSPCCTSFYRSIVARRNPRMLSLPPKIRNRELYSHFA